MRTQFHKCVLSACTGVDDKNIPTLREHGLLLWKNGLEKDEIGNRRSINRLL